MCIRHIRGTAYTVDITRTHWVSLSNNRYHTRYVKVTHTGYPLQAMGITHAMGITRTQCVSHKTGLVHKKWVLRRASITHNGHHSHIKGITHDQYYLNTMSITHTMGSTQSGLDSYALGIIIIHTQLVSLTHIRYHSHTTGIITMGITRRELLIQWVSLTHKLVVS